MGVKSGDDMGPFYLLSPLSLWLEPKMDSGFSLEDSNVPLEGCMVEVL